MSTMQARLGVAMLIVDQIEALGYGVVSTDTETYCAPHVSIFTELWADSEAAPESRGRASDISVATGLDVIVKSGSVLCRGTIQGCDVLVYVGSVHVVAVAA